jgi:hypothetical protein
MEKRLSMALIAGLILSAGWLYGQDSSDDSDDSDTSTASVATDTSPGDVSVTDVSNVSPGNDAASLTPTDPALDFATQQAIDAITNPWGGVSASALPTDRELGPGGNPVPAGPEEAGTFSPGPPTPQSEPAPGIPSARRAQIHAVIVSNLSDPSQVLSGNVNLTGGIIALGPPTPSQKPGRWDPNVQITPDPDLLNGSKIPPLVPNVIDVRITHYEVTATIESQGSVSGQP